MVYIPIYLYLSLLSQYYPKKFKFIFKILLIPILTLYFSNIPIFYFSLYFLNISIYLLLIPIYPYIIPIFYKVLLHLYL